ncbi:MAG: alpha/beta fold hydrolase [Bacteroidetes bacterium]|nr:alpha/beta fold hydrolase [Bacteroidota bacterium]
MKYIGFLFLVLFLFSCGSNQKNSKKEALEMDEVEKQLKEEFGKYIDDVEPVNQAYFKAYNETLELWKVPFVEIYVPTNLGKAHVIVSGPKGAEPLVMLHGMNSSSTVWYPNIKALSEKYRVYAIDYLMDMGKSQLTVEVNDIEQINDWYAEIFDQLKLEKLHLIGASKGGWLAVFIALHQPSRMDKMVLLSPAQTFIWIPPGSKMLSNITFTINPERERLRSVLETLSANVDLLDQAFIDQYFLAAKESSIGKFTMQMRPFSDSELSSLQVPVLVLIGDEDIINSEKSIAKAKELLPNVKTDMIQNAGHFLSLDQPEIVNRKILDFLNP